MKLLNKIKNYFNQCRTQKRFYWIKNRMTKKLDLDDKQQLELSQLLQQLEQSKQQLREHINREKIVQLFESSEFDPNSVKVLFKKDVLPEIDTILAAIADFYIQLQDNQKQSFRKLITAKNHCCGHC